MLGLGLGLFLLIVLWSVTLAVVLMCTRLSSGAGVALTSLTTFITGLLVAMPRHSATYQNYEGEEIGLPEQVEKIHDNVVILKIVVAAIMCVSLLAGGLAFLCGHGRQGIYPQAIKKTTSL